MIAPGLETTGNNSGRQRIDRALAAFNPRLPRLGRVQRQAHRCLIANNGLATITQLARLVLRRPTIPALAMLVD